MVRINNKKMAIEAMAKIKTKGNEKEKANKVTDEQKKRNREEIGRRIKLFLKDKYGKIKIGAEKIGVLEQTLQIYFTGRAAPGSEFLRKIAELGADINYILTGKHAIRIEDEKRKGGYDYPLVSRLSAGKMIEFFDTGNTEMVGFNYYKKNGCMALLVNGDSMNPTIENGDIVLVDSDANINEGCIVAARLRGGEQLIKRFRRLPEGLIQLDSDNFLYDPITIKADELEIMMPVVRIQRDIYKSKK